MKNIFILSFALLIMFMSGACKKDEEFCDDPTDETCPNFDICTQAVAANSDFNLVFRSDRFTDTIIDIVIDTTIGGTSIYKATVAEGMESYNWKIGSDSRIFTGPEVSLDFSNFSGDVSVTLETTADNTAMCLGEFELMDTKTKQIHYSSELIGSIFGNFKGSLVGDATGREYDIRIGNFNPPFRRLIGLPMPDNCNLDQDGIPVFYGYQFFVSTFVQARGTFRCRNLTVIGRINLEDSNELRIDYVYDDDDGKRKEVVFIGRRQ